MTTIIDAATAIPFAVWAAILLLAVAVGIGGAVLAATFRADDQEHPRDRYAEREQRRRIQAAARGWGHR